MRNHRRARASGLEFGGSGEDSFVAVVVTKLTGALLFILLLTMVIMALIPRGSVSTPVNTRKLEIVTLGALPEATNARPYTLAIATRGGSGAISWVMQGELPEGLSFDSERGVISGTPQIDSDRTASFQITAVDESGRADRSFALPVRGLDARVAATQLNVRNSKSLATWLERGFGFIVLAGVWVACLGIVGAMERVSRIRSDRASSSDTTWRFAGYRILITIVAVGGAVALRLLASEF